MTYGIYALLLTSSFRGVKWLSDAMRGHFNDNEMYCSKYVKHLLLNNFIHILTPLEVLTDKFYSTKSQGIKKLGQQQNTRPFPLPPSNYHCL